MCNPKSRLLLILLLATSSAVAIAQNVVNESCGQILNTGTIRLRTRNAEFRNNAPTVRVTNNGIIEMSAWGNHFSGTQPLGSSPNDRIGGIVRWSATEDSQRVQARWYTNLDLAGRSKLISDSVFVGEQYTISQSTGQRYYDGTFYYDGSQQQLIVPEHGSNAYLNLVLLNSSTGYYKQLSSDTATVRGFFINHASNLGGLRVLSRGVLDLRGHSRSEAPLSVIGNRSTIRAVVPTAMLHITHNSSLLADVGGTVEVSSTHGPAAVVIDSGSTFTVASTNTPGYFALLGTAAMNVAGTYRNTSSQLTNAIYDCRSTVRYIGTYPDQVIQATSPEINHRYGKLETSGGNKRTNGDIHVGCGLTINSGITPHILRMGNWTLVVHNHDTTLTPVHYDPLFTDCQTSSEVIGAFRHERLRGTLVSKGPLVFNNRVTSWFFTDTAGVPSSIQLVVLPDNSPNSYNPSTDVRRKVTVTYGPSNITQNWKARVKTGFRINETQSFSGLASVRGIRTYNAPLQLPPNRIGINYIRSVDTTCSFLWVEASSIEPSGKNGLLNGSDLLLRAAPSVIVSNRDGRWSNPLTWADQSEPLPYDTVIVRHNVWVGFTRPRVNGWDGYSVPEAYPLALAARVNIDHSTNDGAVIFGVDSTAPSTNGLFVIGKATEYLSSTVGRNGELVVSGCDPNRVPREQLSQNNFEQFAYRTTSAEPKEHGLVIFGTVTTPIVRVNTLQNTGWIQNAGRLQIGDE